MFRDKKILMSKIRVGILTKNATFEASNIMYDGKAVDGLNYRVYKTNELRYVRGIIFLVNKDRRAIDLISDKEEEYPIMNLTPNLFDESVRSDNYVVTENYFIEPLLQLSNFPVELQLDQLKQLKAILTDRERLAKIINKDKFIQLRNLLLKNQLLGYTKDDAKILQQRILKKLKDRSMLQKRLKCDIIIGIK